MLVDSHCHLDDPDFGPELDEVIARARLAGVGAMLTICTKISRLERVRAIADSHEDVYCSVGVHPHEAGAEPEVEARRLAELAQHPRIIGIGETGLDYHYEHSPREKQKASFHSHIAAARETGLPVIVHNRDADQDTIEILTEEHRKRAFAAVMHCFSAGRELAERAVELGFYISFSGIVTFKDAESIREIARAVPLDKILVETDSPYLAPVPKRGKRNEPAFAVHTAARLADLRDTAPEAFAEATTANFFRLFAKAKAPSAATIEAGCA
jgi:TatD DNase family protein